MKILKKTIATILALALSIFVLADTGIVAHAAKKALSNPKAYDYSWSGDYLVLQWNDVPNAAGYEIKMGNSSTTLTESFCVIKKKLLTYKNGKYSVDLKVRALPAKNSNYTASGYARISFSTPPVSYKSVDNFSEAVFLSKADLTSWLKAYGYTPKVTNSDDGKYTIVYCEVKDTKNDGWEEDLSAGLEGEIEGAFDWGTLGQSALDTLFSEDDGTSVGKKFLSNWGKNADKKGNQAYAEFKTADKTVYHLYYYDKGYEDYGANYYYRDHLQRNHQAPKDAYKNWTYDSESGYYIRFSEIFRAYMVVDAAGYGTGAAKRYYALTGVTRPAVNAK